MASARDPSGAAARAMSRSHSRRAVSRPRTSRNPSIASVPYLPTGPTVLINPDGQISDEAAELLHEFVHPHHHEAEDTLAEEDGEPAGGDEGEDDGAFEAAIQEWREGLPWWNRPSPLWFIYPIAFATVAMSMTLAPRIQILTELACDAYKPEYTRRGLEVIGHAVSSMSRSDDPYDLCVADPDVQKAVSRLSLTMLTTMGILGCLTTAYWGSISDRYGRTRVMGLAVVGTLISDITFISTVKYSRILPGGMWFLLLGSFVDGCLGGYSTVIAAIHAYIADTAEPTSRARTFSLFLGLVFTGVSIGPTLGSLVIRHTHILVVFYIASAAHVIYALLIWFAIPESLSPLQLAQAKKLHAEELANGGLVQKTWVRRVLGFLTPLALLLPGAVGGDQNKNPLKRPKRDWNLFLLALAHGSVLLIMGAITSMMQYMTLTYGWSSEQIGYWSSIVGAARAFHLTIVLPLITKLFQRKTPPIQLPTGPDEPLNNSSLHSLSVSTPESPRANPHGHPRPPTKSHHAHSPTSDLNLARFSICLEIVAYAFMAVSPTGVLFTAWSVFGAFGAGFGPAVSSLATALYTGSGGKELGKLFGALSVVQIICSQVLGPFLYGMTFMHTVGTFPQAVFMLSIGSLTVALILIMFIRLPKQSPVDVEEPVAGDTGSAVERGHPEREDTLVDLQPPLIVVEEATDEDRGRNTDMKAAFVSA